MLPYILYALCLFSTRHVNIYFDWKVGKLFSADVTRRQRLLVRSAAQYSQVTYSNIRYVYILFDLYLILVKIILHTYV